eukprot:EG_transcript_33704
MARTGGDRQKMGPEHHEPGWVKLGQIKGCSCCHLVPKQAKLCGWAKGAISLAEHRHSRTASRHKLSQIVASPGCSIPTATWCSASSRWVGCPTATAANPNGGPGPRPRGSSQ